MSSTINFTVMEFQKDKVVKEDGLKKFIVLEEKDKGN
jgi:hypothetical protein